MTNGKVHLSKLVASKSTKLMGGYLRKRWRASPELKRFGFDFSSYARTLEELINLMEANNSFTTEFFLTFNSLNEQLTMMLESLGLQKKKMDKRIKKINGQRKAWKVIWIAGIVTLLIGSAIAAAIVPAAPIAAGLGAATSSIPWSSLGKWIDGKWKKHYDFAKEQKELLISMEARALAAIFDLDTIQGLVARVEIDRAQIPMEAVSLPLKKWLDCSLKLLAPAPSPTHPPI